VKIIGKQGQNCLLPIITFATSVIYLTLFLMARQAGDPAFNSTVLLYMTILGHNFMLMGIIIGVIALCSGKERIGRKGFTLTIVSLSVIGVIFLYGWLGDITSFLRLLEMGVK